MGNLSSRGQEVEWRLVVDGVVVATSCFFNGGVYYARASNLPWSNVQFPTTDQLVFSVTYRFPTTPHTAVRSFVRLDRVLYTQHTDPLIHRKRQWLERSSLGRVAEAGRKQA